MAGSEGMEEAQTPASGSVLEAAPNWRTRLWLRAKAWGEAVHIRVAWAWCGAGAAAMLAALFNAGHFPEILFLFVPSVAATGYLMGARAALAASAAGLAGVAALAPSARSESASLGLLAAFATIAALGGAWALRAQARRREAQRALEHREAHLRSIFDAAPDGMVVIDEHGAIISFSTAAERIFGWRAEEVIGKQVEILMPQPYRGQHQNYVGRYLKTGEKRIIDSGRIVVGERKGGATFPMELHVGEVCSQGGHFFTGFARDLTERQQTQARLQELHSELVHIARLSALGEMASALAHEINQPLSAISNYLGGARRMIERGEGNDEKVASAVGKASEQALRAGEIIRRLRAFLARGESERKVESLSALARDAFALALVDCGETSLRVRQEFDPRADRVVVDKVQIQQVIVNLVRNALDAMTEVEKRELTLEIARENDEMARVSVCDNGSGLDPGVKERLFQPFVTTKAQGMGVGLSISRTIVESHGGRIWCEESASGGAAFHFTVRLAPAEAEALAEGAKA